MSKVTTFTVEISRAQRFTCLCKTVGSAFSGMRVAAARVTNAFQRLGVMIDRAKAKQ